MKSEIENNQIYEVWDLEIPAISPRTVLYNLPPMNVGTAEVESLSGYISRLAQEHRLSPLVLLKNSVLDLSELPKSILQNSISAAFAGSLNGFGESTGTLINILQKATSRNDIYFTSLMPWKDKLSNHKLLKKHLAWCLVCFHEQKQNQGIVYEKLIWNFHCIKACDVHELPLVEQCPHCRKRLKVLSGKSRPGYCSKCVSWLGSNLIRFAEFRDFKDDSEKKKELWRAARLRELLSKVPFFIANNNGNNFIENLAWLIGTFADGNINDFAHRTGMWHISIRRLLKAEVLPTIEMILKLCFPSDISPTELFKKRGEITNEISLLAVIEKVGGKEEMESLLKDFLEEHPPPSANEVSRRTFWTTTRLQRNFPIEYKKIVERYSEHIKQKTPELTNDEVETILRTALKEKPAPSLQSVFRKLGCRNTGYRYYRKFPELCAKIAAQHKKSNLKKFNIGAAKKVMQQALNEDPPPSFSEVARRLSCTRENLKKKLPKLSASLNEKYKDYLKNSRQQNEQQLHDELRKVLTSLQNENATISMNKVEKLLPRKWNDKNFKAGYKLTTKEMNLKTEK
jgi:F0F1-type ATP synthase membrane subunit b/b'/transcriptional regulator with XRE-family HTH domain